MVSDLLKEYLPIILFIVIAFGLSVSFILVNFIFSPKNPDPEKLSAYECGFEIFDLEIAFLFPWAISLGKIGVFGFISMMIFLSILTVGFIYEWKKGALDWE